MQVQISCTVFDFTKQTNAGDSFRNSIYTPYLHSKNFSEALLIMVYSKIYKRNFRGSKIIQTLHVLLLHADSLQNEGENLASNLTPLNYISLSCYHYGVPPLLINSHPAFLFTHSASELPTQTERTHSRAQQSKSIFFLIALMARPQHQLDRCPLFRRRSPNGERGGGELGGCCCWPTPRQSRPPVPQVRLT